VADDDFLGADLDLGFVADEQGRVFAGPPSRVDLQARVRQDVTPREVDFGVVGGRANLVQSLILRLSTERGELGPLGHPDYGTRHLALIGEPNTETNRNLLKLYVLEALRQEPRLERIDRIDVRPAAGRGDRDKVDVEIVVRARRLPGPLSLVVPFSFEGPLP
jgi:phage baseplate assembly protein W